MVPVLFDKSKATAEPSVRERWGTILWPVALDLRIGRIPDLRPIRDDPRNRH